jgi:hypothetical protein
LLDTVQIVLFKRGDDHVHSASDIAIEPVKYYHNIELASKQIQFDSKSIKGQTQKWFELEKSSSFQSIK